MPAPRPTLGLLLALSTLLPCREAGASHAYRSLHTAVAQSDLIVLGTLELETGKKGTEAQHTGVIRIHEHLAGDAAKGRATIVWSAPGIPSGGVDHRPHAGKRGVWLLHREPKSTRYVAAHDSFLPPERLGAVRAAIASPLYLVDTEGWKEGGRVCCVKLMIRTFLPRLAVKDFVSVDAGRLVLHGRARVELADQTGKRIAPRPGRVVPGGARPAEVVVTRERPHRVLVDLRPVFPLAGRKGEVLHLEWGASKEFALHRAASAGREQGELRSPSYTLGSE